MILGNATAHSYFLGAAFYHLSFFLSFFLLRLSSFFFFFFLSIVQSHAAIRIAAVGLCRAITGRDSDEHQVYKRTLRTNEVSRRLSGSVYWSVVFCSSFLDLSFPPFSWIARRWGCCSHRGSVPGGGAWYCL